MNNRAMRLAWVLLVVTAAAAPGQAQGERPGDALRGPEVPERARRTLVHHSMTGEFQRVLGRPEAAAVEALDLDEETRERAREVIEGRSVDVALLLVREIDRVVQVSDAVLAGDGELARERLRALWAHFEPERARDPLAKELGALLSAAQRAEMARLLDEYWRAWVAWEMRDAPDGDAESVRERLTFQLFQEEVGEGYEATLRRYRDSMDAIYTAVGPTDEQRAEIRRIYVDHIRETQLTATPEQRRAAMVRVYRTLDDDRRERLFGYLLGLVVPDNGG